MSGQLSVSIRADARWLRGIWQFIVDLCHKQFQFALMRDSSEGRHNAKSELRKLSFNSR